MHGEVLHVTLLLNTLQLGIIHYLIKIHHSKNKTFRGLALSLGPLVKTGAETYLGRTTIYSKPTSVVELECCSCRYFGGDGGGIAVVVVVVVVVVVLVV